jgi:hypothetical protein
MHYVTQFVLGVLQFGAVSQPFPFQIGVCGQDPRERFDKARVQIPLHDGAEEHLDGIAYSTGMHMLEAGVAQCGELLLKVVRRALLNVERLAQGVDRGYRVLLHSAHGQMLRKCSHEYNPVECPSLQWIWMA